MTTPTLGLDELVDNQTQAEIKVNEAVRALEAYAGFGMLLDRDLSAPPAAGEGDRYYVAGTGSGDWLDHDGTIALYQNAAWRFFDLKVGQAFWIADESIAVVWDGAAFVDFGTGPPGPPGAGSTVIVQEDDGAVVAACDTIDFTEPNATLVTESPSGEANINMALYALLSMARDFSAAVNVVKTSGIMYKARITGDADNRIEISNDSIAFGDGTAAVDSKLSRASANEIRFHDDLRINSTFKLIIRDSDDSHQTTITGGNQTSNVNITLPTGPPSADGQAIVSTIAGALSYAGPFTSGAGSTTDRRVYHPRLPFSTSGSFQTVDSTAYFLYLGLLPSGTLIKYVSFGMTTVGAGTQVAEIGVFTTPLAANKSGQTLTCHDASGSLDSLIAPNNTWKRNTSALTIPLGSDAHTWVGLRTAMTSTEPFFSGVMFDHGGGELLSTAAASVFAASNTYAGTVTGAVNPLTLTIGPYLKAECD